MIDHRPHPPLAQSLRQRIDRQSLRSWKRLRHGLFNEEIVQRRRMVAAALRAAADQVVPLQLPPEGAVDAKHPTVEWHVWNAEQQARFALLAIATELEAQ